MKGVKYSLENINEKTGRPPRCYSDSQWQKDFVEIKLSVQPSSEKKMRAIRESNNITGTYHGKFQYQYYCDLINDILYNIRHGETDYCYYIYQISDLLKYEYDRLQVEWLSDDECFKVSLTNNLEK